MKHGEWIADAIYGVNDGLAAIFGIVAGVSGFTLNSHAVLESGGFGTLASTLSMGAGAWLAARSRDEIRRRDDQSTWEQIRTHPEIMVDTLMHVYQSKGFDDIDAHYIVRQISQHPNVFHQEWMLTQHGWDTHDTAHPFRSATISGSATLVGGLIPLLSFILWTGEVALIAAAAISLAAHFIVGMAKSVLTKRGIWSGGVEMTLVGLLIGVVSYVLGIWGSHLF